MRYVCIEYHPLENQELDQYTWVAILMDRFLVGAGKTKSEAIDDLELAIAATVAINKADDVELFHGLGPAPDIYRRLPIETDRDLDLSKWELVGEPELVKSLETCS